MDPRVNPDAITDTDRYPTLSEDGRRLLRWMREHPRAPLYRNQSGNRLTAEDIARVQAFDREVRTARPGWSPGHPPAWLEEFIRDCLSDGPFYRRYGTLPDHLADLPTTSRADLSRDIAQFVPDHVPIDRLINFRTSGTTGHPLLLGSHPVVAASYLPLHERALRRFGVELRHRGGQVGVVLVGFQRRCFTYVSVTPTRGESGLAKLNLHPDDWRHPDDRTAYLDDLAAEVYTGDPISLAELATLPLRTRPRALLSTSMALRPAARLRLEERFGCPVLDLYSMNEAGPIAVADPAVGGHVLLQHRLYVEILDSRGRPVPPGERGEVTLTGGFNFCLPLLRYRTGDWASLRPGWPDTVLLDLEGRPPVRYRTTTGEWLNNIEVTHALEPFALTQYRLHQDAAAGLHLQASAWCGQEQAIRDRLARLFGPGQPLTLSLLPPDLDKVVQYTSDLPQNEP